MALDYVELVEEVYNNNNISSSTYKGYLSKIKTILGIKYLNCSLDYFYNNLESSFQKLYDMMGLKLLNYMSSFSSITAYANISNEKKDLFSELHKKYIDMSNENKDKTPKQERLETITWKDIKEKINQLPEYGTEQLLLASYVAFNRRTMDLYKIWVRNPYIIPSNTTTGFLDIMGKPPTITFTEYKNVKSRGAETIEFTTSEEDRKLLNIIFNSIINDQRDYLFVDKSTNRPFSNIRKFETWVNNTLKDIFKNLDMSVGALRFLYANEDDDIHKADPKAKKLSHTINTHMKEYVKPKTNKSDKSTQTEAVPQETVFIPKPQAFIPPNKSIGNKKKKPVYYHT